MTIVIDSNSEGQLNAMSAWIPFPALNSGHVTVTFRWFGGYMEIYTCLVILKVTIPFGAIPGKLDALSQME